MRNDTARGILVPTCSVALLSAVSILGILQSRDATGTEALLFPPWWTADKSFLAAAETGPVLAMGGLPFVVLVPSNTQRARARGQWMQFHASARPGCFSSGV